MLGYSYHKMTIPTSLRDHLHKEHETQELECAKNYLRRFFHPPKGSDRPTSQKKWHWSRDVGSCFSEYQPPTDPTQSAARTSEATLPLSWTKNCTGGTSFFREGSCCEGRCDAVKHAWATSGGNCRCPGVQWLQGNGKIGEALCAPTRTGDTSLEMTCCLNFASCDNDCPRICGDLDLF